jgi:hypothetical protein
LQFGNVQFGNMRIGNLSGCARKLYLKSALLGDYTTNPGGVPWVVDGCFEEFWGKAFARQWRAWEKLIALYESPMAK